MKLLSEASDMTIKKCANCSHRTVCMHFEDAVRIVRKIRNVDTILSSTSEECVELISGVFAEECRYYKKGGE